MIAVSPASRDVLYIYCTLYRGIGLGLPCRQSVQPVEMFYIHVYIVLCTGGLALTWLAMVAASIDVLFIYCTLYRGLDLLACHVSSQSGPYRCSIYILYFVQGA